MLVDSNSSTEAEPSHSTGVTYSDPNDILIVDDNALNRRLLVAFMRKHKYQYHEAQNGLEALVAYRKDPSRFLAILMDITMPVMDGLTATRSIREYEKEHGLSRCSIYALTGLASATARLDALNAGVDQVHCKPINFKALRELLVKRDNKRRLSLASPRPNSGTKDAEINPFDRIPEVQHPSIETAQAQHSPHSLRSSESSLETPTMKNQGYAGTETEATNSIGISESALNSVQDRVVSEFDASVETQQSLSSSSTKQDANTENVGE